jgi:hypothetical protein
MTASSSYSDRIATTGSALEARRAGANVLTIAIKPIVAITPPSTIGSNAWTPYSTLLMPKPAPSVAATLDEHHSQDHRSRRAECSANADLTSAAGDRIGGDSIDAGGGEDEGNQSEGSE